MSLRMAGRKDDAPHSEALTQAMDKHHMKEGKSAQQRL